MGHAKGYGVFSFGLEDIAVSALFSILHFTGWSSKRKKFCDTKKVGHLKGFGGISFGLKDIAVWFKIHRRFHSYRLVT